MVGLILKEMKNSCIFEQKSPFLVAQASVQSGIFLGFGVEPPTPGKGRPSEAKVDKSSGFNPVPKVVAKSIWERLYLYGKPRLKKWRE